jgi:hypothetical protein
VYLNSGKSKVGITVTRIKSIKEKNVDMLPSSTIKIIKKKIEFKKEMTAPKIPRLSKYI